MFSGGFNSGSMPGLSRVRTKKQDPGKILPRGDPIENRTRVTAVKGRCLNRLTMGPYDEKKLNRQRPTFPGSHPPSIIGAEELNFCVRDGNRCDLLAIATGFSSSSESRYPQNRTMVYALSPQTGMPSGQAFGLLVSVSSIRCRTYTSDLSTW